MRKEASQSQAFQYFASGVQIGDRPEVWRIRFGEPGFFRRGEICASLNFDGKVPWVKDKLAKWAMRIEKVSEHDFNKDAGIKSSGDDLPDIECNSFETSSGVTGVYSESRCWLWGWSKLKGEGGPFNLRAIACLSEIIFCLKKDASDSANGPETEGGSCSLGGDEWRRVLMEDQRLLGSFKASLMRSRLAAMRDSVTQR